MSLRSVGVVAKSAAIKAKPGRPAKLIFSRDDEPGIRRRAKGGKFTYCHANGREVKDAVTLDRIAKLAIPPAYSDVWISPDPRGHIQATGRDDRGRKQYRYHTEWAAFRDQVKYGALARFAAQLPKLRTQVDADLRRPGTPRERVIASIVWLLDNTMIRIGNDAYRRDNGSFGLTTLKAKHVEIGASMLRFSFRGKSGKEWNVRLSDRRMARVLKTIGELPGQNLFQYVDSDGRRRPVSSGDVNDYIRETMGEEFSSKHFRTWGGTLAAAHYLAETEVPESEAGRRRALNAAIDKVAGLLGNTRSVCRKCYIHPAVIDNWTAGKLAAQMQTAKAASRATASLDRIEATVAKWLLQNT